MLLKEVSDLDMIPFQKINKCDIFFILHIVKKNIPHKKYNKIRIWNIKVLFLRKYTPVFGKDS